MKLIATQICFPSNGCMLINILKPSILASKIIKTPKNLSMLTFLKNDDCDSLYRVGHLHDGSGIHSLESPRSHSQKYFDKD